MNPEKLQRIKSTLKYLNNYISSGIEISIYQDRYDLRRRRPLETLEVTHSNRDDHFEVEIPFDQTTTCTECGASVDTCGVTLPIVEASALGEVESEMAHIQNLIYNINNGVRLHDSTITCVRSLKSLELDLTYLLSSVTELNKELESVIGPIESIKNWFPIRESRLIKSKDNEDAPKPRLVYEKK